VLVISATTFPYFIPLADFPWFRAINTKVTVFINISRMLKVAHAESCSWQFQFVLSAAERQATVNDVFVRLPFTGQLFCMLEASGSATNPAFLSTDLNGLCRKKNKSNKSKRKIATEWKCVYAPCRKLTSCGLSFVRKIKRV
jgi:hypothetical protein